MTDSAEDAGLRRRVEGAVAGYARALEICVTGREVDAREALQLGLATIVVPRSDLGDAVDDLVSAVMAPARRGDRPPRRYCAPSRGTREPDVALAEAR